MAHSPASIDHGLGKNFEVVSESMLDLLPLLADYASLDKTLTPVVIDWGPAGEDKSDFTIDFKEELLRTYFPGLLQKLITNDAEDYELVGLSLSEENYDPTARVATPSDADGTLSGYRFRSISLIIRQPFGGKLNDYYLGLKQGTKWDVRTSTWEEDGEYIEAFPTEVEDKWVPKNSKGEYLFDANPNSTNDDFEKTWSKRLGVLAAELAEVKMSL